MSGLKVLVTAATGRIGKEVVARLAKQGAVVRAAVHNPAKAEYLKKIGATELVQFDYGNPETYVTAMDGMNAVYSASPDPQLAGHMKFSEYLGTVKSLRQVVRVSCMGAENNTASYDHGQHASRPNAQVPLMLQHYWAGEKCLIDAGVPLTVLRGNFFMNHLLKTDAENIMNEGWFSNPLGDTRNAFICTNDIGEAAVVCLNEGPEKHADKYYDLCGPEPQSQAEIAAVLGDVIGKKVEYRAQDFAQFEKDFGPTRAEFFEYLCNGFYTRSSPDFYNLTGKKPTSYREYLTTRGAAGETGVEELQQVGTWTKGKDAMAEAAKLKL